MNETDKGCLEMGDLFFLSLSGGRPLAGNAFMIRQNHTLYHTTKKRVISCLTFPLSGHVTATIATTGMICPCAT